MIQLRRWSRRRALTVSGVLFCIAAVVAIMVMRSGSAKRGAGSELELINAYVVALSQHDESAIRNLTDTAEDVTAEARRRIDRVRDHPIYGVATVRLTRELGRTERVLATIGLEGTYGSIEEKIRMSQHGDDRWYLIVRPVED